MKKLKKKNGRPSIIVTDKLRDEVREMAGNGLRDEDMAAALDISETALKSHYSKDIRIGRGVTRRRITALAVELLESGKMANPSLLIFWLKTQCGFKEHDFLLPKEEESPIDLSVLNDEQRDVFLSLIKICTANRKRIRDREDEEEPS